MIFVCSQPFPNSVNNTEQGNPKIFTKYLEETANTICGRHPISVFLNVSILIHCQKRFVVNSHCP